MAGLEPHPAEISIEPLTLTPALLPTTAVSPHHRLALLLPSPPLLPAGGSEEETTTSSDKRSPLHPSALLPTHVRRGGAPPLMKRTERMGRSGRLI